MKEMTELTGLVLTAQPYGELDKRLVLLTRERGKITAFARGARRVNSPLLAVCNPFVFAEFSLYEGRSAYNLVKAQPVEFFRELAQSERGVWYGFYFLELASYFAQENLEAAELVDLLYISLRAVVKGQIPLTLLRRIFECRILSENGLYAPPKERGDLPESAFYALHFVYGSSVSRLYSFTLDSESEEAFCNAVRKSISGQIPPDLRSLRMIDGVF